MDIKIGRSDWMAPGAAIGRAGAWIEAKLLALRSPRKRSRSVQGPAGTARILPRDPQNSKVLLLMLPDANEIPEDFSPDRYRALVRLVRR